jgi:hypothetical protein
LSKYNKIDIIVPLVSADVKIFIKNIPFIQQNLPVKQIVVIGAADVFPFLKELKDVIFVNEDCVYPGMTLDTVREMKKSMSGKERRAGWYFQQFLKMGYAHLCKDEYYLIWDSDTIPINKIDFFTNENKPYLAYRDYVKYDESYFRTQEKLLPEETLKKNRKESFVTEHLLVNTNIMKRLILELQNNKNLGGKSFYENIFFAIEKRDINLSGFSEFEVYAAYVLKYYSNFYELRYWKNFRNAKMIFGQNLTDDNINWIKNDVDVISIEDFDHQWLIGKFLVYIHRRYASIKFSSIYKIMKVLIYEWEVLRQFMRRSIKK